MKLLTACVTLALTAFLTTSALAQTDVFTNGGMDSSFSNSNNWTAGVPTSTSNVQIGTQPTSNILGIDTGVPTTVASFQFNSTLTSSLTVVPATSETLQVNGAITNSSSFVQTFSIPVIAGASALYAGGTGLNFGQLTVGTNAVTTSGTVRITQTLVLTLNSTSSFGTIGPVTVTGATINIGGSYTGAAGDSFDFTTGSFTGATIGTLPTLSAGLTYDTSQFLSQGILTIDGAGNIINTGTVLMINNDTTGTTNGFANPGGIEFNGGELLTNNAGNMSGGAAFATARAITIDTTGGTISATTATTATYNGVISNGNGTTGLVTIGDGTNTGTVVFTGTNTYTGGTAINDATLKVPGTLGATGHALAIRNAGVLDLDGVGQTVGVVTLGTGGSTVETTGGAATLATGGVTVNGTANTVGAGVTVTGAVTQSAASALAVNGTAGADALASAATLSGTGTVGAVTLVGTNTLSSAGTLATGGITVSGTGNTISTGTVSGAITQTASSGLTVNGTGGTDALASKATLAGTGTVGVITLSGSNTLSSTGTLATGGVTVNGIGNLISTGTVTGAITQAGSSALTVNGTGGTDALAIGANLSGTGTLGAVTLAGTNQLNSTGTFTTGGITVNGKGVGLQTGTFLGTITQSANSVLAVYGTGGNDNLGTGAILAGSGTVGTVTLAGGDTFYGATTLHTSGITVNGIGNVLLQGVVNGAITQNAGSSLAVNGTGGTDALAAGATLSGTGTVGTITLAGSNTLTSFGTLATGGITVTGAGNKISSGTINGAITQNANSAFTVNGTGGADAVGAGASLTGTGTVGAVTLSSGDTLSSATTLHTGGITVSSTGNTISTGTVTGAVTLAANSALAVNGTASGTISIGGAAVLSGTGTTGAATLAGGSINLQNGSIGTLTVGGLSTGSAASSLSFDIQTAGSVTTVDKVTSTGTLTIGSGITTINVNNLGGTSTLTNGSYALITSTGITGNVADLQLSSMTLDGKTLSLVESGNAVDLVVADTTTATTYTLAASAANSRIIVSTGSTTITSTIVNTGTGDTLTYTGLNATATGGSGTLTGVTLPKNGGPLATNGGTDSGTATYTAGGTTGAVTITPTVTSAENTTTSTPSTLAGTTTATIDVVDNRVVTPSSSTVAFGRVLVGQAVGDTVTLSTTGDDADFTRVRVGTAGADANGISATGGTNPLFNGAGVTDTRTVGGTFTTAGDASGSLTLDTTGEGLTGEAPINVTIDYTADAVNKRVITNGATTDLGTLHAGTVVSTTSNAFTTTGNEATTTSVTVAAGSGVADGNGIKLTGGPTTFDGTTGSDTRTLSGTVTGSGVETGSFNLGVTTLENGGNGLTGEGAYGPVAVAYTATVYTGQGVYIGAGSGSYGSIANHPNFSVNGGAPGLDTNFTTTDTATFGNSIGANTATVDLDGDVPSLRAITFDNTDGGSYILAVGSGGNFKLNAGAGNTATITDSAGNNTISAPIELDSKASTTVATGETLTLSGAISQAGGAQPLTVNGPGTTVLSAANTYAGGTTLASGTLDVTGVGTLGATGSALAVAGGTLDLGTTTQTLGAVTITGGSTIQNGTVDATSVADTASSGTATISAVLGGAGTLSKSGGSTLALNGANTFSGGSTFTGGTVAVGNLTALGTGNVNFSAGTLETGNGVHQINVAANYTQTGGTLLLNLTGLSPGVSPGYEFLNVTGTANLGGALRINVSAPYVPVLGDTFTFVQAGAITGGFTSETSNLSSLAITPQGVGTISITQLPFSTLAGVNYTQNEKAIATYVDQRFAAGAVNPNFVAVIGKLNGLTADGAAAATLPAAFSELSPEKFSQFVDATAFNIAIFGLQENNEYLDNRRGLDGTFSPNVARIDTTGLNITDPSIDPSLNLVHSQLLAWSPATRNAGLLSDTADPVVAGVDMKDSKQMAPAPANPNLFHFFAQGNVVLAQGFSQADVPHFDSTTGSVRLGGDYQFSPHVVAGALFDYAHTDATLDNQGSTANVDSYSPGIYASYASDGFYVNGLGAYTHNEYSQQRQIGFLGSQAKSSPSGEQGEGSITAGYDFHVHGFTVGPTLGAQYTHLFVDGYTESGSPGDLVVHNQNADSFRSLLGGRVTYPLTYHGMTMTPHLDASWQHEFLDQSRGIDAALNGVGGGSFQVQTFRPSRDSALLDFGINLDLNRTITVFTDYSAQAGQENYFGQSVQAGARFGF